MSAVAHPLDSIDQSKNSRDAVTNSEVPSTQPDMSSIQSRLLARQSTVPEVKKDSSGYTWEIYGAEIDPESLRQAIEKHNERMKSKQETTPDPDPTPSSTAVGASRRPHVQRSLTLRDNLWEPVRKLFATRTRSATTEDVIGERTTSVTSKLKMQQPKIEEDE